MSEFDNPLRGIKRMLDNPAFVKWFSGSKVVTDDGLPLLMFHGSTHDFDEFKLDFIKPNETDALYNGFWFTSDPDGAYPSFRSPKNIMPVFLSIKNPAPPSVFNKVINDLRDQEEANENGYEHYREASRSFQDEIRYRLIDMGYDGICFDKMPNIDKDVFDKTGRYDYKSARGSSYWISKSKTPEYKTEYEEVEIPVWYVYVLEKNDKNNFDFIDYEKIYNLPANETKFMMIVSKFSNALNQTDLKVDWSQFNDETYEGTIDIGNRRITVRKQFEKKTEERQVPTGNHTEYVDLYNKGIGHVTGYTDLDEFLDMNKHEIWIAFSPNQIKSIFNKGAFDPSSNKISESASLDADEWPDVLEDEFEIADYIKEVSSSYIEYKTVLEFYRGCKGVLLWYDMNEINPYNANKHGFSEQKLSMYKKMSADTVPPIVIDSGVIDDGYMRYLAALYRGDSGMWVYEIQEAD